MDICIPGSFIVLQGTPGDGASNTIDSLPEFIFPQQPQQQSPVNASRPFFSPPPPSTLGGLVQPLLQASQIPIPSNSGGSTGNSHSNDVNTSLSGAAALERARLRHGYSFQEATSNQTTTATNSAAIQSSDESYVVVAVSSNSGSVHEDENDGGSDDDAENSPTFRSQQEQHPLTFSEVDSERITMLQHQQQEAIMAWQESCRQQSIQERKEWVDDAIMNGMTDNSINYTNHNVLGTGHATNTTLWLRRLQQQGQDEEWWRRGGCLIVMEQLPTNYVENSNLSLSMGGSSSATLLPTIWHQPLRQESVRLLSPGTVVTAVELITLNSTTLQVEPVLPYKDTTTPITSYHVAGQEPPCQVYPPGRQGWIQCLKITLPCPGYIVLSVDGYPFCLPGNDSACLAQLDCWYWRVTCPAGALIREGLDLSTVHKATLPYGSILQVTRKTINAVGLSRLQMKGFIWKEQPVLETNNGDNASSAATTSVLVEGWCSEFLNPLSGQRGPIVQPLSLPAPMLYKVILEEGAVIRSDIELSSPEIGHAPVNTLLAVAGRAFSEHPVDACIERLRLAGGGGWISARLNKVPPHNKPIVELIGMDPAFNPDRAGEYHLQTMKQVQEARHQSRRSSSPTASSCDSLEDLHQQHPSNLSSHSSVSFSPAPDGSKQHRDDDDMCLVCFSHGRNATLVHGPTGHIACCLKCARILKARGDPCPVCRSPIDLVIQHFYA